MVKQAKSISIFVVVILLVSDVLLAVRPATWGTRLEVTGVPNLHRFSEDFFRSGQPTAEGFRALERLGIKTILNLRSMHSDKTLVAGTSLRLIEIPMRAYAISDEAVAQALQVLRNRQNYPLLIHCYHGSDRTGLVCALYRMSVQGWSKEEAVRELKEGGYGFHRIFVNIPAKILNMELEQQKESR